LDHVDQCIFSDSTVHKFHVRETFYTDLLGRKTHYIQHLSIETVHER
jgi:hypothetical protein